MPTRPAPRPEAEASAASSAAQPAQQEPAGNALPPRNHRVNAIFGTDDPSMAPLQEVLEQIGTQFLFGKVAKIVASSTGCYDLASAPCIVEKLEAFLEIVAEQRSRHLRRHQSLTSDDVFSPEDMQKIHREWMEDHESWMNGETLNNYNCRLQGTGKGDHQKAHQIRRSAFSATMTPRCFGKAASTRATLPPFTYLRRLRKDLHLPIFMMPPCGTRPAAAATDGPACLKR